jgi:hypothetical protein
MAKIIEFPTKRWKRKVEEALRRRYGTEKPPEELVTYFESLFNDIERKSKGLRYKFNVKLSHELSEDDYEALELAVNEAVQDSATNIYETIIADLFVEIADLRLELYELKQDP